MADNTDPNTNVPDAAGAGAPAEEPSLRDTIEEQWDAAEAGEAGATSGTTDAAPAPRETITADSSGRQRDSQGRFTRQDAGGAPSTPAAPARNAALPAIPQGTVQPPAPAQPELKAPGSWRPEVREAWSRVPPDVQGEVIRREREFQQVLMHAAGARQFTDAFERVVAPYQLFIRQENSTPLQAVENLMQTAALLRTGNQQQRVEVIASIIKNWCGSEQDLKALDSYLAGHQLPHQGQQQQPMRDPRVDQMLYQHAMQQQHEQQQMVAEFDQGIEWFSQQPGHEFFEDVRVTMGDLIDMAGKRGQILTMEDAYQRACQLEPSVSKILQQRASAHNASALSQAALRAKRAARSVTGDSTPSGATVPRGDSVRASVEAAWEAHEGR